MRKPTHFADKHSPHDAAFPGASLCTLLPWLIVLPQIVAILAAVVAKAHRTPAANPSSDVLQAVTTFFDGMRAGNSTICMSVLDASARLQTATAQGLQQVALNIDTILCTDLFPFARLRSLSS